MRVCDFAIIYLRLFLDYNTTSRTFWTCANIFSALPIVRKHHTSSTHLENTKSCILAFKSVFNSTCYKWTCWKFYYWMCHFRFVRKSRTAITWPTSITDDNNGQHKTQRLSSLVKALLFCCSVGLLWPRPNAIVQELRKMEQMQAPALQRRRTLIFPSLIMDESNRSDIIIMRSKYNKLALREKALQVSSFNCRRFLSDNKFYLVCLCKTLVPHW